MTKLVEIALMTEYLFSLYFIELEIRWFYNFNYFSLLISSLQAANSLFKNVMTFFKLALILFFGLNIIAPIVVYVWPNIMSHMIFETFS